MRASRLLSMLILLQARGRMSAAALAREFEVSVRTVYRDADQLSAAGVPVFAERGRSGGFRLLEGFGARLAELTAGEAEALALSGVTQAAADLGLGDGARAARTKLLANLPARAGASAAHVAARFHLDPLPWYGRRAPPPSLREVAAAVWSDRRIRLRYESWRGEVRRTVTPLGLVMKAGAWYLVAAARAAPRTYRVDAIRALDVLSVVTARPTGFDLARYWADAAVAFEEQLASASVRVRLSAVGIRLLRDFHPRAWEALQRQAPTADAHGHIEATLPFESGAQGVRDALRMGAEMEVLAPADLRKALADEAARTAARHARDPAARPPARRASAR
jgi:predicted DNA-binding transcriptional regulator YafY